MASRASDRLTRTPKRFLIDASVMVPLLGVDTNAVLRDGNLLGRALKTMVVARSTSSSNALTVN